MELCTCDINGSTFCYADYPGEKGPILAIHGLTGNYMQLHHYIEALKGEYRIIAVDVKGRGHSVPLAEHSGIDEHVADLLALMALLKIEYPILLGFSMGGFITAKLASQLPQCQGLMILDGAADTGEHQQALIAPSLSRVSRHYTSATHYVEELKGIYASMAIDWSDYLQDVAYYEIEERDGAWQSKVDETVIRADLHSLMTFDAKTVFYAITCPILLVHATGGLGDKPALFLASHYQDTLASAQDIRKVTSDANHYTLVFEKQPVVQRAMHQFLQTCV